MSNEALMWAKKIKTGSSSAKSVLLVMADDARSPDNLSFKTVQTIASETELNRKTVLASISKLVGQGFLKSTGDLTGRTGRIPVYQLCLDVIVTESSQKRNYSNNLGITEIEQFNDTKIGTVKQDQKRNGSKSGIVPKTDETVPKSTSNGPSFGTQNLQEPTKEPSIKNNKRVASIAISLENLPEQISPEIAQAFLDHRKAKKCATTQHAFNLNMAEALKACELGLTPDDAINETIKAGWQAVNVEYLKNRLNKTGGQYHATGRSNSSAGPRPASAIERRLAARAAEDELQGYRKAVGQNDWDVRAPLDVEFRRED